MKGYEKWADKDARSGSITEEFDLPYSQEYIHSVRRSAFIRGFKLGREKAAAMIERLIEPSNVCDPRQGLPILIRGIGEAKIEP